MPHNTIVGLMCLAGLSSSFYCSFILCAFFFTENMCELPAMRGGCSGREERWHYNSRSQTCEPFSYSGCGGNKNNFVSRLQCESSCPGKDSACHKIIVEIRISSDLFVTVDLSHLMLLLCEFWYFGRFCYHQERRNSISISFWHAWHHRLLYLLSDIVVCPVLELPATEPTVCSRSEACVNASCPEHPAAICDVNPCSCAPYFTDSTGRSLECDAPRQSPKTVVAFSYEQVAKEIFLTITFSYCI